MSPTTLDTADSFMLDTQDEVSAFKVQRGNLLSVTAGSPVWKRRSYMGDEDLSSCRIDQGWMKTALCKTPSSLLDVPGELDGGPEFRVSPECQNVSRGYMSLGNHRYLARRVPHGGQPDPTGPQSELTFGDLSSRQGFMPLRPIKLLNSAPAFEFRDPEA